MSAEMLLAGGAVSAEMLLAWAPGRSAIGKLLLAGALLSRTVLTEKPQGCIGKTLLAEKPQAIGKKLLAGRAIRKNMLAGDAVAKMLAAA